MRILILLIFLSICAPTFVLTNETKEDHFIQNEEDKFNTDDKYYDTYKKIIDLFKENQKNNLSKNINIDELKNNIKKYNFSYRDDIKSELEEFIKAMGNISPNKNNIDINNKDLKELEKALGLTQPEFMKDKDFKETMEKVKEFIINVSKVLLNNI